MKASYLYLMSILLLLQSCSTSKKLQRTYLVDTTKNYFTGLVVFDPEKGDTLISYNGNNYFTPASTVKLFTLYTALKTLPDSIATISYAENRDTLYFKALADPSFLHDSLPNTTFKFLKNTKKKLVHVPEAFDDFIYGDGWQWDDYQFYYMPEKSIFPIYGNLAKLRENKIQPSYFQAFVTEDSLSEFHRDFTTNVFYINSKETSLVPFKTAVDLSITLLQDTLQKPISISSKIHTKIFKPYTSTPTQPLYQRLMDESENFIAEQLFLIIAKNKTEEYKVHNAITYALDSLFIDIPDKPRWVDASGLSRYNIFTPRSMVYLLDKMLQDFGKEASLKLLPKNGENGSLQKWYPHKTTYLYAKTGSLSNNHSLSGYLITKKGRLLIFSYMNNNYINKSSEVRAKMNQVLQQIYNNN